MLARSVIFILFSVVSTISYAEFLNDESNVDGSFQKSENFNNEFPPLTNTNEVSGNSYNDEQPRQARASSYSYDQPQEFHAKSYNYDLPRHVTTVEKVIVVDPNVHAWGAYDETGRLIYSGRASAGAKWCEDIGRPCKTRAGVFRIYSLGDSDCVSSVYPVGEGGAPMPYCMYFNGSEGLHGSNNVVNGNISHGCVRLRVSDAEWLRYNFATQGTKVIIKAY